MSQYTVVNIIGEKYDNDTLEHYLYCIKGNPLVRVRNGIAIARYGGDVRQEFKEKLMSPETGELVYNLDIAEEGKSCYVFIDKYEDTGNSHETELYEVLSFEGAKHIDSKKIDDDLYGEETEKYYNENHNLNIDLILH